MPSGGGYAGVGLDGGMCAGQDVPIGFLGPSGIALVPVFCGPVGGSRPDLVGDEDGGVFAIIATRAGLVGSGLLGRGCTTLDTFFRL